MTVTEAPVASAEDRAALRSAVAGLLADHCTEADVRRVMATPEGYDPKLWQRLGELGLLGLAVPAQYGGSGSGFVEVGIVLEELGRVLYPGPFLATTLAALVLARASEHEAAAAHLPAVAAGDLLATVAVEQPRGGSVPVARVTAADGELTGVVPHVLDGHVANLLLVGTADGLWLVAPGATGVSTQLLETTDATRRLARVELDATPAVRIGGPELVDLVLSFGAAALASDAIGGAEAVLAASVAYAKVRTQFGRPIGSFQAIKHHCAEMYVGVESGKAAARRAAREVALDGPELAELAAIAKAWCSDTYAAAAGTSLQIHGGIGFTWDHSAHLHLKRAKTDEQLFGDAPHHRARLAAVFRV